MILCLRRLGKRYNNLQKQGSTNGNDSRFAHLGQQLSLHPHLHCIVPGGGGQEEQWKKIVEVIVNFYFSKALSKVLERSFAKTQTKRAYKIRTNKTRFMEETLVVLPETIGNTKSVVEYLGRYTIKNSHKQP
jgi:hypothetical protein